MSAFYRNLWVRKMPASEALWEAKRELRKARLPVSTWAGWVMTGNPE